MNTIPDGAYNYYLKHLPPRLCYIERGYVYFLDDDEAIPVKKCSGKFVRLEEVREAERMSECQ